MDKKEILSKSDLIDAVAKRTGKEKSGGRYRRQYTWFYR